ncbi:ABC transporter [Carbonactinospora thermoautotrophica]|uniref:ABC transporter ATP-binding protein n=1 Tax=Carbonactinospora thermoautotrophica TaxID=1469144 RepID=UPI00226F8A73|nr:ABC transporter ATP-binding protein [Carbonactinospora thermoautotrophica]MCX9193882.1 ABC transporter [Carbonactinospora thermoautotrophica]
MNTPASTPVIRTEKLVKYYGRTSALDGLDLEVQPGEVFGYLGPNGAGKTTTIRLLLDLIRPTSGQVRVLGQDPRAGGPKLRRRIGYLAGDFAIDGRQPVREALTYLGDLRGGVPARRIRELAERLDLDLTRPIRSLSKGNRQKVGLVQAFMHTPELLILDEPTSGLDPLVQQEFLAMVREAKAAGQTVFMSSHVLSEVQHAADRVGIIRAGRLVTVERVEALRSFRKVEIHFAEPVPADAFTGLPHVSQVQVDGTRLRCRLDGHADALVKTAGRFTVVNLRVEEPDLEELFFAYYNGEEASRAA